MKDEANRVLDGLNDEQKRVCQTDKNCVLLACPGSGKTRTIVHRLAWLQYKHPENRKYHIAITYTNRASEEMENRLQAMDVETEGIWTGTIHQFCMEFIIRPYAMYSERLKYGYHIIDEFQQNEYIQEIKEQFEISNPYYEWKNDCRIVTAYKQLLRQKKEIDFDDILIESVDVIKRNPFIAENISRVIFSIHVDEYQDTNENQYVVLSEIFKQNPAIMVMFVGDVNQAIFSNLGGVAKSTQEIAKLFGISFEELRLTGCYRSTQRIVDFYSKYAVKNIGVRSLCSDSQEQGIISYNNNIPVDDLGNQIAEIIKNLLDSGIPETEICVIAPRWEYLFSISKLLRAKLPSVAFDAPDVTPFKYDPTNPFYLIAWLLFTTPGQHERIRRRRASELMAILQSEYGISFSEKFDVLSLLELINRSIFGKNNQDGLTVFKETVQIIFKTIGVNLTNETVLKEKYDATIAKTEDRMARYKLEHSMNDFISCFKDRRGIVITTLHSVKGEEYHTVIAFGLLNGILPHWDYIYKKGLTYKRKEDTYRLIYVLLSRAKKNIYLISETGRKTKSGSDYMPTGELRDIQDVMDDWPTFNQNKDSLYGKRN